MNPRSGAARPTRRSAAALAAPALATLFLAGGCGAQPTTEASKDANDPIALADDPATGSADATVTTRSSSNTTAKDNIANSVGSPFDIDRTVWFSGFKIKLTRATPDPSEGSLVIEAEAQNDGIDQASLYESVRLEQDGVGVAEGQLKSETTVLAGSTNAATVEFSRLGASYDPSKAVLVMGDAKHQQVKVPLKGDGPSQVGEPYEAKALAPVRTGSLTVTTEHLTVRNDTPEDHDQAPRDKAYVIIAGNVRFDGRVTNVQSQNFSLIPPNGAPQSPKYVNALPTEGSSDGIYAVFAMPAPIGGEYTLRVQGNFVVQDGFPSVKASTDTRFTLDSYPRAGTSVVTNTATGSGGGS
jgi:hypothetical protein